MTLNYNNTKINYTISGKGNAVVLVHGFIESLEIWNYFAEKLVQNYSVLCIDLPGHGESGCIGEVHSMDIMAEVVKAVLDEIHVKNCVMIGHSMGGYVTLAFAEKYPDMLNGFGLFHSSAHEDTEEARLNRSRAVEIIKKNHHGYLTSFIPDLFTQENQLLYLYEIKILITEAKKMTKEAVTAALEGMKIRPLRYHVLEKAVVPVLFIFGHKDSRIPFPKVMEQILLPEEAHVLLLKNTAHMGYIEAKEETFYFVKSFVDQIFKK